MKKKREMENQITGIQRREEMRPHWIESKYKLDWIESNRIDLMISI